MDRKEYFKILKEIGSLEQSIEREQNLIKEESKRLTKIQDLRAENEKQLQISQDRLIFLENDYTQLENQYAKLAQQIDKKKNDLNTANYSHQIALEEQIKSDEITKLDMDTNLLQLIEEISIEQENIKNYTEFKKGSEFTLMDIEREVMGFNEEKLKTITQLKSRVEHLILELPNEFQKEIQRLKKSKIWPNPFSQIQNHQCAYCGYAISRIDEDSVERALMLINCNSCGRLFIPINSLYA